MTTVPAPRTVNARSTHSRTSALGSGSGSRRPGSPVAARTRVQVGARAPPRPDRASEVRRLAAPAPSRRSGSARSALLITSRPCRTPSASSAARCSVGLRHPPLVAATTNMTAGTGPTPGEHVRDEPLVARHVDERELSRPAMLGPGEAEVDGQPAAVLLGQPVGLHAGERAARAWTSRGRRARRWRRRACSSADGASSARLPAVVVLGRRPSAGRAGSGRPRPARRPPASPVRSGGGVGSGRLTAALGSSTPGAPPPPTARRCSRPARARPRQRAGEPLGPRPQRRRRRRAERLRSPAAAARAASPPARPGSACRPAAPAPAGAGAAARPGSASPNSRPACGPPSSLSPLAVTRSAPSRSAVAASGSSGSSGCGRQQAGADVDDERDAERGQLGDRRPPTVNPVTGSSTGGP